MALAQPELRDGIAAFTDSNGDMVLVSASAKGLLRIWNGSAISAASLTKPLVAYRIKQLVSTGLLKLDQPISNLLAGFDPTSNFASQVTVRNLLQHTSGLYPQDEDPLWRISSRGNWIADCERAARIAWASPVRDTPGKFTAYSNSGYCILGQIARNQRDAEVYADTNLDLALTAPLGGAGGYVGSLQELYESLFATLPVELLPQPEVLRPDGSWYTYGWRRNVPDSGTAPFSHFGHLDGLLTTAQTDGSTTLLVAHFEGRPKDPAASAQRFEQQAWQCLHQPNLRT